MYYEYDQQGQELPPPPKPCPYSGSCYCSLINMSVAGDGLEMYCDNEQEAYNCPVAGIDPFTIAKAKKIADAVDYAVDEMQRSLNDMFFDLKMVAMDTHLGSIYDICRMGANYSIGFMSVNSADVGPLYLNEERSNYSWMLNQINMSVNKLRFNDLYCYGNTDAPVVSSDDFERMLTIIDAFSYSLSSASLSGGEASFPASGALSDVSSRLRSYAWYLKGLILDEMSAFDNALTSAENSAAASQSYIMTDAGVKWDF